MKDVARCASSLHRQTSKTLSTARERQAFKILYKTISVSLRSFWRSPIVLYNLHWLPVNYRIQFKILMITFKAIHGMAPSYLSNLICIRSSSRYSLRNNDTIFLERPKGVMRTTLGARSFHASAPALWNSLPAHIRTIDSLALFKKSLKTYLLKLAF